MLKYFWHLPKVGSLIPVFYIFFFFKSDFIIWNMRISKYECAFSLHGQLFTLPKIKHDHKLLRQILTNARPGKIICAYFLCFKPNTVAIRRDRVIELNTECHMRTVNPCSTVGIVSLARSLSVGFLTKRWFVRGNKKIAKSFKKKKKKFKYTSLCVCARVERGGRESEGETAEDESRGRGREGIREGERASSEKTFA